MICVAFFFYKFYQISTISIIYLAIFSRRFSCENSPTSTVTSFFSFFRQTTDLIVYVPLFTDFTRSRVLVSTVFTRFTVNPAVTDSSLCFSQKFFRAIFWHCATLSIFFGTVRLFFDFFLVQRVLPPSFFDILQQTKVPTSQSVLPFHVIRHFETFRNSHFLFFFRKLKMDSKIFCLQRVLLSIYLIFCNKLDFQKARKVLF